MGVLEALWNLLPVSLYMRLGAYFSSLENVKFIVKADEGAWLFRTGLPLVWPHGFLSRSKLDPQALRQVLQRAASGSPIAGGAGGELPEDVRLLDISLLGWEWEQIEVESSFFKAHPEQGKFLHWPLYGLWPDAIAHGCSIAGLEPSSCPQETRQPRDVLGDKTILASTFPQWDSDNLVYRVQQLHQMVQSSNNTAIFFHCSCGCDRTGELFAAYAMTHLNWTLQDALKHNVEVEGRKMWYQYQVSTQWYCEWLQSEGLYHHDDCSLCGGDVPCENVGTLLDPFAQYLAVSALAWGLSLAALCVVFVVNRCFLMNFVPSRCRKFASSRNLTSRNLKLPLMTAGG
mmetsp:Transcript_71117/g.154574  ORF Transcript_71117/g.154574 Transcript_71117/m.154574 type:complete len:344 (-) Transcript_71117:407-1438(-)